MGALTGRNLKKKSEKLFYHIILRRKKEEDFVKIFKKIFLGF